MQIIFIDETGNYNKNKKFFGLGGVVIDSFNYKKFKDRFCDEFGKMNWNEKFEFKGRYLFSQKGDKKVSIDSRINFVKELAKISVSKKNARYDFLFCYNFKGDKEKNYLELLGRIVDKIKPKGSGHKNVAIFLIDRNDKYNKEKVIFIIEKSKNKKITIFERPFFVESNNLTPGIITTDVLSYLKTWAELSPKENDQLKLFGKIGNLDEIKLNTIKEILSYVKNIKKIS